MGKNKKQEELEFSADDFVDEIDVESEVKEFVDKTDSLTSKVKKATQPKPKPMSRRTGSGFGSTSGRRRNYRDDDGYDVGFGSRSNSFSAWEAKQKEKEAEYTKLVKKVTKNLNKAQKAGDLGVDAAGANIVITISEDRGKVEIGVVGSFMVPNIDPDDPMENYTRKVFTIDTSYGNATLSPDAMRFLIRSGCFEFLKYLVDLEDRMDDEVADIRSKYATR